MACSQSANSNRPSPHVIMFAGPMYSHCVPYMLLARRLCAFGINITYMNTESIITNLSPRHEQKSIQTIEGDTLGVGNGRLRVAAIPNGEGYQADDSSFVMMSKSEERLYCHFKDFVQSTMDYQDWAPPCCLIFDAFVGWVMKITDPLKIPGYILWTTTAASIAMLMHAPILHAQRLIPVDPSEADKLKPVEIPCIPPLHPLDFIGSLQRRNHVMHHLLVECSKHVVEASGILINSLYELESSVFDALHEHYQVGAKSSKLQSIIPIGPLLPASMFTDEICNETDASAAITEKRDPVLQWLDNQPRSSVIYVSFGSLATLSASQLIEMALGLESSGQRFIWVVRSPSDPTRVAASSEVHQYLPSGHTHILYNNFCETSRYLWIRVAETQDEDTLSGIHEVSGDIVEGFTDRIQGRGFVVTGWAPQVQILQHLSTGGFLTHCGWNSVMESISGSVPMLAWPIQAEQMMNTRWLVDIVGAALRVRNRFEDFATREQVENAIRLLMSKQKNQALKNNVVQLRDALGRGLAESGSSQRNLKAFAENLHHPMDVKTTTGHEESR